MKRIRQQQGVALLVVLILLVMMSALAAKISQQFCRNLQKTHYNPGTGGRKCRGRTSG